MHTLFGIGYRGDSEGGQAMLLTVTVLSSVILGAASLASVLVTYQLRQVTDSRISAQAIFATDAGIERALFERFGRGSPKSCATWNATTAPESRQWEITSESDALSPIIVSLRCTGVGPREEWFAVGRSKDGRVARAMKIVFTKR